MFDFDKFRKLAKERHLSISALCEIAGVSSAYVAERQRSQKDPNEKCIAEWAKALHTTTAYLMGETDDPADPLETAKFGFSGDYKELSDTDLDGLRTVVTEARSRRKAREKLEYTELFSSITQLMLYLSADDLKSIEQHIYQLHPGMEDGVLQDNSPL